MALLKVMCVDDDRPILDNLHHFAWEENGCQWIGEADNGQKALEMLPLLLPDLIILDIQMPVMDGLTFIPLAQGLLPEVQFLILTAYCDFNYARRAMRFGITEYLTKGEYSDHDLATVLQKYTKAEAEAPPFRFEIKKCIQLMELNMGNDISLLSVARQLGISPNYLGSLFFQQTGMRFRDYLLKIRMERARDLLLYSPLRIYEISEQVGIKNPQYFSTLFQKIYGLTPGQMRK